MNALARNPQGTYLWKCTGTSWIVKVIELNRRNNSLNFFFADFQVHVNVVTIPHCIHGPLDVNDSVEVDCRGYHYGIGKWLKIDPGSTVPQDLTHTSIVIPRQLEFLRTGHWAKNVTLKLRNVKRSDRGKYVCSKSNGYNATANISIIIDVAGKLT